MKKILRFLDPAQAWVIWGAVLAAVALLEFAPASAGEEMTPYRALLEKAGEIQKSHAEVAKEYALAAVARENQKPAALVACGGLKNEVTQALCVLGVNGQLAGGAGAPIASTLPPVTLPAPPPEPESWGSKAWNGFLAVADRGLAFMGIREGRRERTEVARLNAGVQMHQIDAQAAMVGQLSAGQVQITQALVQPLNAAATAPQTPTTLVSGNTGPVQVGGGVLTFAPITGSYNPTNPAPVCFLSSTGQGCNRGP